MDSRKYFVRQVADTIIDNHGKDKDASFIFGISGKWGEGKTYFLGELKKVLEEDEGSFKVYDEINPWKFNSDKHSFLRNFLKTLHRQPVGIINRIRFFINDSKRDIQSMEADISETRLHKGWLAVIVLYSIFFSILYFAYPYQGELKGLDDAISEGIGRAREALKDVGFLASLILFPVVIFFTKIVSLQKSSRSSSTLDNFDRLLKAIIKTSQEKGEKIVIFIDDLDRLTPSAAREVLDNLRTFFDKQDLTFVVTGDHVVLERYLGSELIPSGTLPEQKEEGRRFLKKIFNVYWRLPQAIDGYVTTFVESEVAAPKRAIVLKGIFKEEESLNIFKVYLQKYFEKNFRQIIRFLDTVIFNFQIVQNKANTGNKAEKKYFGELLENPLLVVRILMIQELCAPLFDYFLLKPELLIELEQAADRKDGTVIDEKLDPFDKENMTKSQASFIREFLYEQPGFVKDARLRVSDVKPFLFFAADSSFGDSRGTSGEDFMKRIAGGDPSQVVSDIALSGSEKTEEMADAVVEKLRSDSAEGEKIAIIQTLISALGSMDKHYFAHQVFRRELKKVEFQFLDNRPAEERVKILSQVWRWLEEAPREDADIYVKKFPFMGSLNFDGIDFKSAKYFTSRMIVNWLIDYYQQNKVDGLAQMNSILRQLPEEARDSIQIEFSSIQEEFLEEIFSESNEAYRGRRIAIVRKWFPDERVSTFKSRVLSFVESRDRNVYLWAKDYVGDPLWTQAELDAAMIAGIKGVVGLDELRQLLDFIDENGIGSAEAVYGELSEAQLNKLAGIFPSIALNSYAHLVPPKSVATKLRDGVIEKMKDIGDTDKEQWATYLKKEYFWWKNLSKGPSRTKLKFMLDSDNPAVKDAAEAITESWK